MVISIETLAMVGFMLLAFFSQPLGFGFLAEAMTVLFLTYIILYLLQAKTLPHFMRKMGLHIFLLIVVGLVGNICSGVERPQLAIVLDILYLVKVFICFNGAYLLFCNSKDKVNTIETLAFIARIIIFVAFVCMLVGFVTDIGMTDDVRYGIPSFKFIFDSSAWLSQYWILIVIILTAERQFVRKTKNNIFLAMAFVIWAMTLRSRAFAIMAIYFVLWMLMIRGNKVQDLKKHIFKFRNIVLIILLVVVIAYDQIDNYFTGGKVTARFLLLETGFKILKNQFPIGTGLATFGTEMARRYYSPIYYNYGLNSFWALREGGSELTDCYWPAIFGEFGVIGTILVLCIIWKMIKECIDGTKEEKYLFFSVLVYLAYLVISSTVTAIFASDVTALYMVIIAYLCTNNKSNGDYYEYNSVV